MKQPNDLGECLAVISALLPYAENEWSSLVEHARRDDDPACEGEANEAQRVIFRARVLLQRMGP